MLYDRLENLEQYTGLFENLDRCIEWIQENDVYALPLGKTEIQGEDLFVNVMEITPKAEEEIPFESHSQYMDLQMDLVGSELFQVALGQLKTTKPYDPETDCAFFQASPSIAGVLGEDRFAVFMVEEPHKPGIRAAGTGNLKKAVFKIRR